jgi:hypothetical protein
MNRIGGGYLYIKRPYSEAFDDDFRCAGYHEWVKTFLCDACEVVSVLLLFVARMLRRFFSRTALI